MIKIKEAGVLYIVATPIGNCQDISFRAVEILQQVNCIAAEDTRHSALLLQRFSITTPMISLYEHNEQERVAQLILRLQQGESIALISDAGTPLISDPGYVLVREVKNSGISVVPIPGACAAIAALSASGLAADRFVFEGFLPAKGKARLQKIEALKEETRTLIFYEAPHRVLNFLEDFQAVFGKERRGVIARELTKKFETLLSGTLKELQEQVERDTQQQKGEFVILIEGGEAVQKPEISDSILKILLETLPLKQAVEIAEKITGNRKNSLYQKALSFKGDPSLGNKNKL